MDTIERFWSYVQRGETGACWPWLGKRHTKGYGIFWFAGKSVRANRFALELHTGPPSFNGAFAIHSCDNPPCCNPSHLRWGTALENTQDDLLRRGDRKGENSPTATVTNAIVAHVYQMRLDGYNIAEIAEALSLPATTVEPIYVGRVWKHRLGVDGNPTLNQLRTKRKPRTQRISPNRILTDAMVDHILQSRFAGRSGKDIAAEMKLPLGTISPVFSGLAFTHRLGVAGNPTFEQLRSVRAVGPNIKLTEDDVTEIRALLADGVWGADIAARYGVSTATISHIKAGKR